MKKLVLIFILLLPTLALAQQKPPLQSQIEAQLGAMIIDNIALKLKIEELTKQVEDLKKQQKEDKK